MSCPLRSLASPDKNSSKMETGSRIEVILYAFTFLFTWMDITNAKKIKYMLFVSVHLGLLLSLREGVNLFNKL